MRGFSFSFGFCRFCEEIMVDAEIVPEKARNWGGQFPRNDRGKLAILPFFLLLFIVHYELDEVNQASRPQLKK